MNKTVDMSKMTEKDIVRFWSKVAITHNSNDCWFWTAGKSWNGYGLFYIGVNGRGTPLFRANRIAYFIANKVDPSEKIVLHKCDNPSCCNPNHLSLGTIGENMKDRDLKGRQAKGEKSGMSKLKESDIKNIREEYMTNGTSWRKLAREYGVHNRTIGKILHSNTWNHI
jgi:hypothetical protein